jgi:hypothetical protein
MREGVRIAKADLAPTKANLRGQYGSFAELASVRRSVSPDLR